jgi:hypothetical protein
MPYQIEMNRKQESISSYKSIIGIDHVIPFFVTCDALCVDHITTTLFEYLRIFGKLNIVQVLVADVAEAVHTFQVNHSHDVERMHGRIAPTFVKEAT